MTTSTKEQRRQQVEETNGRMRQSGFEPDDDLLELERLYIDGGLSAQDILDWGAALMRKFQHEGGQDTAPSQDTH